MITYRNSSPFVQPTYNAFKSNAVRITPPKRILFGYSQSRTYSPSSRYHDCANWKPHILWPQLIVPGDFNKTHFMKMLPKFYQHIACSTRASKTLKHCYSPFQDGYKALPRSPSGKSDHNSILLPPSYRQKLKQEVPMLRSIQRWSEQSKSMLQHVPVRVF